MMTPQRLTPELPRRSSTARRRTPMVALYLVGLLGSAVACSGSIDNNEASPSSGSATNAPINARGNAPIPSPAVDPVTETTNATNGPSNDLNERQRDTDDIRGVSGGTRSSTGGRRGGGSRASDAVDRSDAGDVDAGVPEADAGLVIDADAGLVIDAGAALP